MVLFSESGFSTRVRGLLSSVVVAGRSSSSSMPASPGSRVEEVLFL